MKRKSLERAPVVHRDLEEIAKYILRESGSRVSARRVLVAINDTFKSILDSPDGYVVVEAPEGGRELPYQLRKRPVTRYRDYLVFYTVLDEEVRVLRVIHGARDWISILFDGDDESDRR